MHGTVERPKEQREEPSELPAVSTNIDLTGILGVLRRRKWVVLSTAAVLFVAALAITIQLPKRYTATALVVVDSRDSQMLGFSPGLMEGVGANALVDTEAVIARSSKVMRRAATNLELAGWPEFAGSPGLWDRVKALFGFGSAPSGAQRSEARFADLPDPEQIQLVKSLTDQVSVSRVGLTSVISISATTASPGSAAEIANGVAVAYLQEQVESKVSSTERAASFLDDRVKRLAGEIDAAEGAIDQFISTTMAELGSPEARDLLLKLASERRKQQTDGRDLARLRQLAQGEDYAALAELAAGRDSDLYAARQALVAEATSAGSAEAAAAVRKRLDDIDREIRTAADQRIRSLEDELTASSTRTSEIQRQVQAALTQLELPKQVSNQLISLQRDAESRRALYDSSLAKLRQVEQQTDFNVPDSRVIASAEPPNDPSFPPRRIMLGAALLLSLGAGIGLAFLREHFIGGVTSAEQLENLTGRPVVASVPRHATSEKSGQADAAVINEPLSAYAESIRRIRMAVEKFSVSGKLCLFVTSALPGDGKTTIGISLARQMAMTGNSTLLIDADLRHPAVHRYVNRTSNRGLIDYLCEPAGESSERLSIIKEPASGAYFVLGAEDSSIATDALLMSRRFDDLVSYARENFDVVIIDTPPIGLVVDASIVAKHCDLGLFIVRYAQTSQLAVHASLRDLLMQQSIPVCCVLNQTERATAYGYGSKGRYRDYYRSKSG